MIDYNKLYELTKKLVVLDTVLQDELGQTFCQLLQTLGQAPNFGVAQGVSTFPTTAPVVKTEQAAQIYTRFVRLLAQEAELYNGVLVGDAWQNHVLDRLLDDKGVVATKARRGQPEQFSVGLKTLFWQDLARLQYLCQVNSAEMLWLLGRMLGEPQLVGWDRFNGIGQPANEIAQTGRLELKQDLLKATSWPDKADELLRFYRNNSGDELGRYTAFRWQTESLVPIAYPDKQYFENLVGYADERKVVTTNTEQFLEGLPANNVLLYGARGTGKSSTVKALLTKYADQGLRLIEVHKSNLNDYVKIAETVRPRPEKFILFVDDLSFEADDASYKDLKSLLEGSLAARPANLLIYATSNRHHLIREQFSDDDEPNAWDTTEEVISLSDRFGLLVTFQAPNQSQYLEIVDRLAEQIGLLIEQPELHRRALRWELSHSGRSGRTARQFIDALAGELRLSDTYWKSLGKI